MKPQKHLIAVVAAIGALSLSCVCDIQVVCAQVVKTPEGKPPISANKYAEKTGANGRVVLENPLGKADDDAYGKGCKFLQQSDARKAIEQFNKVIKSDPKNSMAFCKRGEAYAFMNNDKLAMKDYNTAIRLNSKNAEAYY